jgi:hypothetical protein
VKVKARRLGGGSKEEEGGIQKGQSGQNREESGLNE